jgi:hypothetical protein
VGIALPFTSSISIHTWDLSCGLLAIKFSIYSVKEILTSLLTKYSKQLTRGCKLKERMASERVKRGKKYIALKDERVRGKGLKSVISAECQPASFPLKRNWCYCVMESKVGA